MTVENYKKMQNYGSLKAKIKVLKQGLRSLILLATLFFFESCASTSGLDGLSGVLVSQATGLTDPSSATSVPSPSPSPSTAVVGVAVGASIASGSEKESSSFSDWPDPYVHQFAEALSPGNRVRIRVEGPEARFLVVLNGKTVGETPFDAELAPGVLRLELHHPDYQSYAGEWNLVLGKGLVVIKPDLKRSSSYELSRLQLARGNLRATKKQKQDDGLAPVVLSASSFAIMGGGLGLGTAAYILGNQSYENYQSANTSAQATSYRNEARDYDRMVKIGIGTAGAGLLLGLLFAALVPDTAGTENELKQLDAQIRQLGGL